MPRLALALSLALCACLAPTFAAAAQASDAPQGTGASLGGRAVWAEPDDAETGTWNPGFQARYRFSRYWALEGSADYLRLKFPGTTAYTAGLQASLLAYIRPGRLAPFLLGGAGYYLSHVSGPSYRREIGAFGPHVGVGAQWFLTPRWSVDATWRHVWARDVDSNDQTTGLGRRFRRAGSMVTAALNFHL